MEKCLKCGQVIGDGGNMCWACGNSNKSVANDIRSGAPASPIRAINSQQGSLAQDIRITYWVAIGYGLFGVISAVIYPLLGPAQKTIVAPHFNYDVLDLFWNFITGCFSIWWGTQLQKNPSKRLVCLTNLLGLYIVKIGIVTAGLLSYMPHIARFAYLLPAVILFYLGRRTQIKIQVANDGAIRERYRLRLLIWIVVPVIIVMLGAAMMTFVGNGSASPLLNALDKKDAAGVILAVKNGESPNQIVLGQPLIFLGIKEGDDFYVKTLVEAGADVNIKSNWGRTPLHQAALHGQVEIVKFLLQHGADVNARNNRGETPLFYAEGGIIAGPKPTAKHAEVAQILKESGGTK